MSGRIPGKPVGAAGSRAALLEELDGSALRYATVLQLLGTAPYYNSEAAMEIVLSHDRTVTAAAARYGVEKEMLQAVLFQEIRFWNVFDHVDLFVAATHTYLEQAEHYAQLAPEQKFYTLPPVRPLVFRVDSSTGLGQIFADTAIRAINWREGYDRYDRTDWHDLSVIWARLRDDDAYNIETAALVLAYKRSVLQARGSAAPAPAEIMQAYNGAGELSVRYREVTWEYYLAFQRYSQRS